MSILLNPLELKSSLDAEKTASLLSDLPSEAFHQAVNQADLAISITDTHANILFANEAFGQVTGYAPNEIVGCSESVLSNKTTPRSVYKEMWATLSAQRSWSGKLLNRHRNGTAYLAELIITPIIGKDGKTTHYLGMHRDVTEMHRLERLVRNQKHLIESVIDRAPMAMALIDPNGKILLDNQEYKKLVTDLRVKEPAFTLLDEFTPGWRETLLSSPQQLGFSQHESRHERPGQRTRWLATSALIIDLQSDCVTNFFQGGGTPGLLLLINDITSLREEQERARAAALKATLAEEERTAAIREGLSAALFRLEEPMNIMASAISILQRRDPEAARILQSALEDSRSHMENLRQVIPQSPQEIVVRTNLNETLREVLEVSTPRLLNAGIEVDWQPSSEIPVLLARPSQLRMLFKALVDNAIEAMNIKGWKRRELKLSTEVCEGHIRVSIFDSGPGIPQEWRLKAFEPFFTAKNGSGKHIGTGLSRAQQVVADHGGIIDLEDSPLGGCAVIVEFRVDGDPI